MFVWVSHDRVPIVLCNSGPVCLSYCQDIDHLMLFIAVIQYNAYKSLLQHQQFIFFLSVNASSLPKINTHHWWAVVHYLDDISVHCMNGFVSIPTCFVWLHTQIVMCLLRNFSNNINVTSFLSCLNWSSSRFGGVLLVHYLLF